MNPFFWYPPAETRIRPSSFMVALLGKRNRFEKELCSYLGIESCVLANSGRASITLLLRALKATAGTCYRDEVLIPAYTCYSVAASVVRSGLKIRVYDIKSDDLGPDIISVKREASKKTLAIVVQHLFGIPSLMEEMKEIAEGVHSTIIEDAAQALGGILKGHYLGTIGDFGFFSFGRGKPLPLGYGGAFIARNKEILHSITLPEAEKGYERLLTSLAIQFLSYKRFYGIMETLPLGLGKTIFSPDFNISSMPQMIDRLGSNAIHELNQSNMHKRIISDIYSKILHDCGTVPIPDGAYPTYTRFPLMVGTGVIPNNLRKLGVRRMYPNALVNEPDIRQFFADQTTITPGAALVAERLITLPTHSGISEDVAEEIACKVKDTFKCK